MKTQLGELTAERDAAIARAEKAEAQVLEWEAKLQEVYYRGCQEAFDGTTPECPYRARIARLEEALRRLLQPGPEGEMWEKDIEHARAVLGEGK